MSVKGAFAIAVVRRDEMREDLVGESGNAVCISEANSWRKSSEARSNVSCVFLCMRAVSVRMIEIKKNGCDSQGLQEVDTAICFGYVDQCCFLAYDGYTQRVRNERDATGDPICLLLLRVVIRKVREECR